MATHRDQINTLTVKIDNSLSMGRGSGSETAKNYIAAADVLARLANAVAISELAAVLKDKRFI